MNKELINDASKKLSPKKVLICSSNTWVDEAYDESLEEVREIQTFKGTSHLDVEELERNTNEEEPSILYCYNYFYNVGIRCTEETDDSDDSDDSDDIKVYFEIKAKFKVTYISTLELEEDCATEFAKFNVGHTVWPYWREFVQSSCQRMGINGVEIPFYSVE